CALNPEFSERDLAQELRRRAPSATPNGRLVSMADKVLGREGRMIDAIREIGRGATAFEGTPFEMPLD
ncbi:MAG: tyrosine protein phosphatase, partial [Roseibium sp.]